MSSSASPLSVLSRKFLKAIPWSGNHVMKSELRQGLMLPWGFLSQLEIKEWVTPSRENTKLVDNASISRVVDTLDICEEEFNVGAEQAYLVIAEMFQHQNDFLMYDVTSPDLSTFLNDVTATYQYHDIIPVLNVFNCKATLKGVRLDYGGVSKNRYSLGLMSKKEAMYHILTGVSGPEGQIFNENNKECPLKLIAEVEYECEEEFKFLDRSSGEVLDTEKGTHKHYWTFETDVGQYSDALEWQIKNINDVLKPALSLRPEFLENKKNIESEERKM